MCQQAEPQENWGFDWHSIEIMIQDLRGDTDSKLTFQRRTGSDEVNYILQPVSAYVRGEEVQASLPMKPLNHKQFLLILCETSVI